MRSFSVSHPVGASDALSFDQHEIRALANVLRALSIDGVEAAKSGHPGLPLGMADMATVLWTQFLKLDPAQPHWSDRDRLVLSAGHGSMLLYSLLYVSGFGLTLQDLKNFRQKGSLTPGHPEYGHTLGVETTTGPLGQGVANGVGMALSEAILREDLGPDLVDHYTYVLCGDGCLMEGVTSEAISLAGHLGLGRLILIFDDNSITIDGAAALATSENHQKRFQAAGWHVVAADGHDALSCYKALEEAKAVQNRPSLIMCRTTIGFGAPTKAGTCGIHGSPLGTKEAAQAKKNLGFSDSQPFKVPQALLDQWRQVMSRGKNNRESWEKRFDCAQKSGRMRHSQQALFSRSPSDLLPGNWLQDFQAHFNTGALGEKLACPQATRASSGHVLDVLAQLVPALVGGSADLTGSNNTYGALMRVVGRTSPSSKKNVRNDTDANLPDKKLKDSAFWACEKTGKAQNFSSNPCPDPVDSACARKARYVHYGVREHAMGGILSGLSLHGGMIPYGGTFLVFSDYMRPAMRLAAMMHLPVTYVLTHDSIGLGEDGPTHQPIEHLASLRLIPNLLVLRPADGIETAECWMLALDPRLRQISELSSETTEKDRAAQVRLEECASERAEEPVLQNPGVGADNLALKPESISSGGFLQGPCVLALSRQKLPPVRSFLNVAETTARGAYVLKEADAPHRVSIMAAGSEVSLAVAAGKILEQGGVGVRVISAPCLELFQKQPISYQRAVWCAASLEFPLLRVSLEAGSTEGWKGFLAQQEALEDLEGRGGHLGQDAVQMGPSGADKPRKNVGKKGANLGNQGKKRAALCLGLNDFGASAPAEELFHQFGLTADCVAEKIKERLKDLGV